MSGFCFPGLSDFKTASTKAMKKAAKKKTRSALRL